MGSQSKVFFVESQLNHRAKRVTIGRADVISVDAARKRALAILSDMALGKDANPGKRRAAQDPSVLNSLEDGHTSELSAVAPSETR